MNKSIVILAVLSTLVGGCSAGGYATQTRKLKSADVVKEVDAALQSGDKRFVGVMGVGLIVPGVPDYHSKYSKTHGVRVIENTSDVIENDAHMTLQEAAYEYGLKYNTELLKRLL